MWAGGRISAEPCNSTAYAQADHHAYRHADTETIEQCADNHSEDHPQDHAASSFERHYLISSKPRIVRDGAVSEARPRPIAGWTLATSIGLITPDDLSFARRILALTAQRVAVNARFPDSRAEHDHGQLSRLSR